MNERKAYAPPLHPAQRQVWDSPARFKVLAAGRRWGKTRLGALTCVAAALACERAWWVAPSFPVAAIGWRMLKRLARNVPAVTVRETEKRLEFGLTGGFIQVKSADKPDGLRGEGLDLVILDECAYIREEAWAEALRPALSDRQGRAMFISTPNGRNWFYRMFERGQEGKDGWQSWQFPTSANPFIAVSEIENARLTLPERVFLQEFMAKFVNDAGSVFRRVMEAATATAQDRPVPGHTYVFGVDWGKYEDWTVITVLDTTVREVVALERFNQIDYVVQSRLLKAMAARWRPLAIVAESNAMGAPLVEQLQRDGLPVVAFATTHATKVMLVESLMLAFETGALRILPNDILIRELQAFEMQRLPSGLVRYSAPAGLHDDCVMSLALAWYGCTNAASPLFVEL